MSIEDGRCWREVHGEGPTVVLVHGTMDRASSFGRVQRVLDDFQIVRYDRRGYGRSLDLGVPTSFHQQVDDLLDVIGDQEAIVFGHSYGGTIALAAAQVAPTQVVGVAAYECPLPWFEWWPADSAGAAAAASTDDPAEAGERFMQRMIGEERWRRLPRRTREARRAEGATLVAELAQLRPPHPPPFVLSSLRVPVVAAHGTEGAPHHAEAMRVIADGVPGAELEIVEGAGHGVHLTHPAKVGALVRRLAARAG